MELFARLMAQHQDALFRYIFALHPREDDAREILQEACVALLQKFDEYDSQRPFLPWACRFARLKVLKKREALDRDRQLVSVAVVELLAQVWEQRSDELQHQLRALDECLEALPEGDRDLVRCRYHGKARMDELVRQFGGSSRTLFRNLERVRRRLFECITRRLATDDTGAT
jgi:RNA polymerase sigma-70 factor, ECF subfamily